MLLASENGGFAARLTFDPLWKEIGLPLAAMGILVVFAALVLLALFITLLPRLMAFLDRLHPEQKPAAAGAPRADDQLPEELLVVIAAAVAAVVTEPHRVVRIRGLTPEDLGWSLKGRLQHHASHSIQPRKR